MEITLQHMNIPHSIYLASTKSM